MQNHIQENVIALFDNNGFRSDEAMGWEIVKNVFEEYCQDVMHSSFKAELLTDLLEQCRFHKQKITPTAISEVICEAHAILIKRLSLLQGDEGLIQSRKQTLTQMQQQLRNPKSNTANLQKQMISMSQNIYTLERQIAQLVDNQRVFESELEIINRLFNGNTIKLTRQKSNKNLEQPKKVNPKYLVFIFYMAMIGMLLEFFIVKVRPGWIALTVYFQALFLILVGYYNKKAVYTLIITGIISTIMDLVAIYLFYFQQIQNQAREISQIMLIMYLFLLLISMILRLLIMIAARPFMQPPLLRVYFKIWKQQLTLNTRLKIGMDSPSLII